MRVRWYPETLLQELNTLLSNPMQRAQIRRDLTEIYVRCLTIGDDVAMQFEQILQTYGARLQHQEQGPAVHLGSGEPILLDLPEKVLTNYMLHIRWREPEAEIDRLEKRVALVVASK
jgi:hypothetical protein